MKVELLYFDGCPSYERLLPHLRAVVASTAPDAAVECRRIGSAEDAAAERFLGSPTVRVDGRDVEPGAETRTDFGIKCRLYRIRDGLSPVPSDDDLVAALRRGGGGRDQAAV